MGLFSVPFPLHRWMPYRHSKRNSATQTRIFYVHSSLIHSSTCQVPVIRVVYNWPFNPFSSHKISQKPQISTFGFQVVPHILSTIDKGYPVQLTSCKPRR